MKNSVQDVLDSLARRWTGEIMVAGAQGSRRFGEYRRQIEGISDRMLTLRLRELDALGLLERTVVPSTPVQVFYAPTEHGLELLRAIQPLAAWGVQHEAKAGAR